jgi:hypothetical protein
MSISVSATDFMAGAYVEDRLGTPSEKPAFRRCERRLYAR